MHIRFWGTRGSIPTPGPQTIEYGGNTSCVEVRTNSGVLIMLDCGTGLRELGRHLLKDAATPVTGHMFISHTHWDHIQGFPFFGPLFLPSNHFIIYGAPHMDRSLEATLGGQMEHAHFPVLLSELAARMTFREVEREAIALNDVVVKLQHLNHTTACLGYRIEADNASVVYMTDTEPCASYLHAASRPFLARPAARRERRGPGRLPHEGDERIAEFAFGADLLIMDAQYSAEEYEMKRGWGHSSLDHVMDFAIAAQVKRVALFHHDPEHSDAVVASFESYCREKVRRARPELQVFAARERGTVQL